MRQRRPFRCVYAALQYLSIYIYICICIFDPLTPSAPLLQTLPH